MGFFLGIVNLR